mmetsp:Transcript_24763/g.32352  ORF Transcript_24763/g.32352 Transcript_24763/m.32352 type:complete len:95 (+) Transcript_24763:51-335(+)
MTSKFPNTQNDSLVSLLVDNYFQHEQEPSTTSVEQDILVPSPNSLIEKEFVLATLEKSLMIADCIEIDAESSFLSLRVNESPMHILQENFSAPQ